MASRFTDTEIWSEDWFCEMGGEYQLFTKYVFEKCDNAGVWKPNKIDFEIKTKFKVSLDSLFKKLNGDAQRVLLLENSRWFLTGYILFQWFNKKKTFDLVLSNRLHKSLYDIILTNNVPLTKIRGLKGVLKGSMVMDSIEDCIPVLKGGVGEKWKTMPDEQEMTLELPDIKAGAVIELLRITKRQEVTKQQVYDLWGVFKAQNFTGKKFYQDEGDVFSHFINWSKTQNYADNQHSKQNASTKLGTSEARVQALKDW